MPASCGPQVVAGTFQGSPKASDSRISPGEFFDSPRHAELVSRGKSRRKSSQLPKQDATLALSDDRGASEIKCALD
jgi:hypothetical protein